jgi:hypothetical protein
LEQAKTDEDAKRINNATPQQVNDTYACLHSASCTQQAIDEGKFVPWVPSDGLSRDESGKIHNPKDTTLPDHVPDNWDRETLEHTRDELKESIKARKLELQKLGEHASHRERLRQEERLLRQIEKKLSGS